MEGIDKRREKLGKRLIDEIVKQTRIKREDLHKYTYKVKKIEEDIITFDGWILTLVINRIDHKEEREKNS